MTFRVGIDLDGVLADLEAGLRALGTADAAERAPSAASADELPVELGEPRGEGDAWERARQVDDFWETLPEIEPGAVRALFELAEARRWEVVFLTQRPRLRGRPPQRQTQRWLARHGFELPSVCVVTQSRGRIADALSLDCVVDDRWESCVDVLAESRARPILMWREDRCRIINQARGVEITVVSSLPECFEAISEVERKASATRGVWTRALRWLDRLKVSGVAP